MLQLRNVALNDNDTTHLQGIAMLQILGKTKMRLSFEDFTSDNEGLAVGEENNQIIMFGKNTDVYLKTKGSARIIVGVL